VAIYACDVCGVASKNFRLYEITVDADFLNVQLLSVLREDLRPNEVAGLLPMCSGPNNIFVDGLADPALNAECSQRSPQNVGF
jgi:hypothetical protein